MNTFKGMNTRIWYIVKTLRAQTYEILHVLKDKYLESKLLNDLKTLVNNVNNLTN